MAYKFNPLTGTLDEYGPVLTGTGTVSAAADGTAGVPGIAFASDLDTGIYRVGANSLGISTGGTGRLFVDANGRVGIGVTNPTQQLDVRGPAGGTAYYAGIGDASLARILVGYNPFGGAGTADSAAVSADNFGSINLFTRSGATNNVIFGTSTGTGAAFERMRLDNAGRLLVGTSSARTNFFNFTTVTPGVQIESTNNNQASLATICGGTAGSSNYIFARHRGNIGEYSPVTNNDQLGRLSFQGADGAEFVEAAAIFTEVDGTPGANDMPGRLVFSTTADGAASPTERLRITSDGYVRLASGTGGIQFNGDTAAANALDDYEEGAWTSGLTGVSGSNVAGSTYTKIGNIVRMAFNWRSRGTMTYSSTAVVEITGWPFAVASGVSAILYNTLNANGSWTPFLQGHKEFIAIAEPNGNTVRLFNNSTGAAITYGDIFIQPSGAEPALNCVLIAQTT
jgi:hypothetical protein